MTEQTHKRYPRSHYAKVMGEYCCRAIERVKGSCEKKVNHLYEKFPYNGFAEKKLHQLLNRERIYEGQGCYADCISAGMLAYIYGIHRCAYMGYTHVEGYISKMLRIYLLCAVVVYRDSENLCKEKRLSSNQDRPDGAFAHVKQMAHSGFPYESAMEV